MNGLLEPDAFSDAIRYVNRLKRVLNEGIATRNFEDASSTPQLLTKGDWAHFADDLKLLRNRCAQYGHEYCITLIQAGMLDVLCQTIQEFAAHRYVPDGVGVLTGQLLANLVTAGGEGCARATWSAFFPHHLNSLVQGSLQRQVSGVASPLALSLLMWCKHAGASLVKDLLSAAGIELLAQLLSFYNDEIDAENIRLLFGQLVFTHELLRPMYISLTDGAYGQQTAISLLCLLADDVRQARPGHSTHSNNVSTDQQHKSIAFLVLLFQENRSNAELVRAILDILSHVFARDDGGGGLVDASSSDTVDMVYTAVEAGILGLLLEELRALTPPLCRSELYPGYKSDLLAVLGNMTFNRSYVQQKVCDMDGVKVVLSQCERPRADPYAASPLAREWALWTIRNLCEGSVEARTAISNLQLLQVLESEELERANLKVTVDEGRLRIGKRTNLE
jgi:ataxin-10